MASLPDNQSFSSPANGPMPRLDCSRLSWSKILVTLLVSAILAAGQSADLSSAPPESSPPFLSLDHGVLSRSPWLFPGKLDFRYQFDDVSTDRYNAMFWTPTFKGGVGWVDPIGEGNVLTYGGGYVRPLAGWPERGDLILGAQFVDASDVTRYEAQGEYRFPWGLGFGGGIVGVEEDPNVITFGKLTFRRSWGKWNSILEIQAQDQAEELSPGGYVAVYNDVLMGVGGTDGEQWRAALGVVAPAKEQGIRPAAEVLYVDNSIGNIDAPRVVFANATLNFRGGFLSHAARLGRAMGPQGLEYGNPLGFLQPTFNRRLDVWELGGMLDLRFEHIRIRNQTSVESYQGVIFPFQFWESRTRLDGLFAGATYLRDAQGESPGVLAGLMGKLGFLNASVAIGYEFDPHDLSVVVGLIDPF